MTDDECRVRLILDLQEIYKWAYWISIDSVQLVKFWICLLCFSALFSFIELNGTINMKPNGSFGDWKYTKYFLSLNWSLNIDEVLHKNIHTKFFTDQQTLNHLNQQFDQFWPKSMFVPKLTWATNKSRWRFKRSRDENKRLMVSYLTPAIYILFFFLNLFVCFCLQTFMIRYQLNSPGDSFIVLVDDDGNVHVELLFVSCSKVSFFILKFLSNMEFIDIWLLYFSFVIFWW